MERPTIFEAVGGESAFLALAAAHHQRCLDDPVLEHPFSHPGHPDHVQRLASYWAEVFGGPPRYSQGCGGHAAMLGIHAGTDAEADLGSASSDASCRPSTMPTCPPIPSCGLRCAPTWSGPWPT